MKTEFFLGANSGAGFYSLYDGFCAGSRDFLHVIKGGPGTGKSGFMRRIGAAAEKAGLNVEYVVCSGDPGSLDGVYIPALHTGWVDGTAPHVMDPVMFGATGDYLDLGAYCDTAATRARRSEIAEFNTRYKALYATAYSRLSAAAAAAPCPAGLIAEGEIAAARRRALSACARELPHSAKNLTPGKVSRRFLSAYTCEGRRFLTSTLTTLCKRIYTLDDRLGLAEPFLETVLGEAVSKGVDAIVCPDPLTPQRTEALLLPSLSLGFLALRGDTEMELEPCRHLRLDAIVPSEKMRPLRARLRADERTRRDLLSAATDSLAQAKALHDELEKVYNPYVDFPGLKARAEEEAAKIIQ